MGMFNYVKGEYKLGCCGKSVDGWQSKDASVIMQDGTLVHLALELKTLDPKQIDEVYAGHWCEKCKKSTEHRIVEGRLKSTKVFWYYND